MWHNRCRRLRPTSLNASSKRARCNAGTPTPLSHRQTYPANGQIVIRPRVVGLLLACGPSHVAGFVMSGAIDAVYRVATGWPGPHVRKKVRERLSPSITHAYPASAVPGKVLLPWVLASAYHRLPCAVFWRIGEMQKLTRLFADSSHYTRAPRRNTRALQCLCLATRIARIIPVTCAVPDPETRFISYPPGAT